MTEQKSMAALWQDYLFLSKELHKFTSAGDMALFEDILRQRKELAAIIKETPDTDSYIGGAQGQALIRRVAEMDKELYAKLTRARNLLQKNLEITFAYEGVSEESAGVGRRFDSGRQ
ncbi:MAG: hypothetical protein LBP78_05485 [Acidaminococcales bacterium]|jgi:hypothetical protein|nr:hypothetical protein [Acidaminococcales bacterium]